MVALKHVAQYGSSQVWITMHAHTAQNRDMLKVSALASLQAACRVSRDGPLAHPERKLGGSRLRWAYFLLAAKPPGRFCRPSYRREDGSPLDQDMRGAWRGYIL